MPLDGKPLPQPLAMRVWVPSYTNAKGTQITGYWRANAPRPRGQPAPRPAARSTTRITPSQGQI